MKVLESAMKTTQIPQLGWLGEDYNELVFPTHTLTLGPNKSQVWTMHEAQQQIYDRPWYDLKKFDLVLTQPYKISLLSDVCPSLGVSAPGMHM